MGDYYGVKFKIKVKEQHRAEINKVVNGFDSGSPWALTTTPSFLEYAKLDRSSSIPFGGISAYIEDIDGFEEPINSWDKNTGMWEVCCNVYTTREETVRKFVNLVYQHIVEEEYFGYAFIDTMWDYYGEDTYNGYIEGSKLEDFPILRYVEERNEYTV